MPNATLIVLSGNADRREGLVRILSEAGWQAIGSSPRLSEAGALLRHATEACAIVDAELEDVPGLTAIPILRSLCSRIKIVFVATQNSLDLEAQVRAADVFYYHVGPADSTEVEAAVKDAIGEPARRIVHRSPKVLIVDDDPDFHVLVRTMIEPSGYSVVSAYSYREGLEMARQEMPDVVLLDIIMETTTDGFVFCQEARRDPSVRHTPILGVSAIEKTTGVRYPPDSDPNLFPVDGYLSKPVTPKKLLAELKRLVAVEG